MFWVLIKFKNAFLYTVNALLLFLLHRERIKVRPRSLLLIRLDAIGDYILFRNYLEVIHNSKRFKDYKITLCGNIIWKDIAEVFDKKYVNDFIWIDRKLFYNNTSYRFNLLKQIKQKGFETVVDTAYSREILYGDTIVRASGAKVKVGSEGAGDKHVVWKRKLFSKNIYTELIPAVNRDTFEFCRNREFVSSLLHEKVLLSKPFIDVSVINTGKKPAGIYAVLFFGASTANKIWDVKNFIETGKYLVNEYNLNIVLAGGSKEKEDSHLFTEALPVGKVTDLCGNTSIPELARIISDSSILISNESMAVHLAAAVDKNFVCITNGERIVRFHPYPHDIFDKGFYIYPEEISANISNKDFLEKFRFGSGLDINSIPVKKVKEVISKVL
jgi:ADP-heptose:LPS heptosyltransferase